MGEKIFPGVYASASILIFLSSINTAAISRNDGVGRSLRPTTWMDSPGAQVPCPVGSSVEHCVQSVPFLKQRLLSRRVLMHACIAHPGRPLVHHAAATVPQDRARATCWLLAYGPWVRGLPFWCASMSVLGPGSLRGRCTTEISFPASTPAAARCSIESMSSRGEPSAGVDR